MIYDIFDFKMKKKALVLGFLLVVLFIGAAIAIIYLIISEPQEQYLGNKNGTYYFNYFKCERVARKIDQNNLKTFGSEQEAKNLGYKPLSGCV